MLYVLMLLCVLVRGHHGVSLRVSDRGQWFLGVSFRPHHSSESAGVSHVLKLRRSSQSGHRSSEGPSHPHLRAQGPGAEEHHQDMDLMDQLSFVYEGWGRTQEEGGRPQQSLVSSLWKLFCSLWLKRILEKL